MGSNREAFRAILCIYCTYTFDWIGLYKNNTAINGDANVKIKASSVVAPETHRGL